jgi:hypothetical protein
MYECAHNTIKYPPKLLDVRTQKGLAKLERCPEKGRDTTGQGRATDPDRRQPTLWERLVALGLSTASAKCLSLTADADNCDCDTGRPMGLPTLPAADLLCGRGEYDRRPGRRLSVIPPAVSEASDGREREREARPEGFNRVAGWDHD